MRAVIIVFSFLFFVSCGDDSCREDHVIEGSEIKIDIQRLEKELFQAENPEQMERVLNQYPAFSRIFLHADQYPHDSILAAKIYQLTTNPSIDTLYNEAADVYEDLESLRRDIESIFGKLQALYPETQTPKLQTAVTGLYNDLFISDSLIIVGIDFFIGENATYRPHDIPIYMLKRYDRAHLPAIIAKVVAGAHVNTGRKNTLLSEMVDFGKTYFLASRLLPCTSDSILMGYTPKDMRVIHENQQVIWANLVENEVLYETSHITKQRFLGERPNVYEISEECPGRIGAWIGWQIVESYMAKNNVEIKELLAERDNEKIFRLSGYKPRNR